MTAARALRSAGIETRDDDVTRAAYSSDASLYRVPPVAVAFPRSAEEVASALDVARALGTPVTARGAGTSVAGNAVGSGVVLDLGRHLHRVLEIDPEGGWARVEPGVVQRQLQEAVAGHGLRFGPDPSTSSRCTIGGMIGNDACGPRSLQHGRTADNVLGLRLVTGGGEELRTRDGATEGFDHGLRALDGIVRRNLAVIRRELGLFPRHISGYPLHHLLPENGVDLTRALVGTEGSLGIVTEATVRLVRDPSCRLMVALGFADILDAAAATLSALEHGPSACEGLDRRIVEVIRDRQGAAAVPELPRGQAWLFCEVTGDDEREVLARARRMVTEVPCLDGRVVTDAREAAALWRIREDGAGLSGRAPSGRPAWPGWEDAAVPPAALADYLRDFDELVSTYGFTSMPFGHFGEGCIHVRIDFPLDRPSGTAELRSFLLDAARLVAGHGGSLSGEHGDGRARSELLPLMYSADALRAFAAVKAVFDPDGVLNPGVVVDPPPVDTDLRVPSAARLSEGLAFAYPDDDGDLSRAVHRCTGVGKCRVGASGPGSVMCPSYAATREEKDSTRGRARVLQEMVNGTIVDGWRSPAVRDALDLCLSCKGCASDCPTGIDMATYKAEATHQAYRGRLRPRSHYTLGRLPMWARLASRTPRLANALTRVPGLRRLALFLAGVDHRRTVPTFATQTFRAWFEATEPQRTRGGRPVLLFVDSFTDHFAPQVGRDAVRVLEDAGYRPEITSERACCGLTWISTGQLDQARAILAGTVDVLERATSSGVPIVGLEPSCTAVLRHDAPQLLDSDDARRVAAATRTLAELLSETPDWEAPDLAGTRVVAQPHCHHHAVMGWETDAALLERAGVEVERLGGCCGLAGNFGVERGHHQVSVAVAELQLLPALRRAPDDLLLADGFSCRTQSADLADRPGVHLAELLARALPPSA